MELSYLIQWAYLHWLKSYVNINKFCVYITWKVQLSEYIYIYILQKTRDVCMWVMCDGWCIAHDLFRILLLSIEMWSLATFYSTAIWLPKYQILAYPKQILKWIHIYQQDQQALLGKYLDSYILHWNIIIQQMSSFS